MIPGFAGDRKASARINRTHATTSLNPLPFSYSMSIRVFRVRIRDDLGQSSRRIDSSRINLFRILEMEVKSVWKLEG